MTTPGYFGNPLGLVGYTLLGDIAADNWDGAIPADLVTADPAATAGFYLDASQGAAQFMGRLFLGGDLTFIAPGFIRTALSGNRIEIRPAAGGLVASVTMFTGAGFTANEPFIETEDQGGGVWALKLVSPVDADVVEMLFRSDGVLDLKAATDIVLSIGGPAAEVARFTEDGLVSGPLGVLGHAEVTAPQLDITAEEDLTGLSVTVDVAADRLVRLEASVTLRQQVATGAAIVWINEGSTKLRRWDEVLGDNHRASAQLSRIITPSEGAHTYKLTAMTTAGNLDVLADDDANLGPSHLVAEDIGPA